MKKKTVLSLFAAAVAVAMMLGSTEPVFAAGVDPVAVQQQLPAKDLTKFDLMETWHYLSNAAGNPNPAIVRNADGTYNIIMFEGTAIILDVNNPIYNDMYHQIGIQNYEETEAIVDEWDGLNIMDVEDSKAINDQHQLLLQGVSQGAAVINVGIWNGDIMTGGNYEKGQNITIGVFVIPAQPGAQAPTYSHQQATDIACSKNNEKFSGQANGTGADGYGF